MTPFGHRVRELRAERNITQKQMASELGVSAAYLSALEKGNRGAPSWDFVQRVIGYFNIIWDDAEELENLALRSHPKAMIDTSNLSADATELANLLGRNIEHLKNEDLLELIHQIKVRANRNKY